MNVSNVIRFPALAEPPDTLMALLEAADGLPDETVARLIDRYFPEALVPSWWSPLRPTDLQIRRAVAIGRERGRQD